ncbi:hypothetical protein [Chryseobacterium sp. KMC2]|uniref:hypothetical protein n=1 Tax=Chryseobacterium sp. KMC2 TaxID=2800705 RepID=UPI001F21454E|nr:hypothetical protein [Chryseobacterium sp. KMC2]
MEWSSSGITIEVCRQYIFQPKVSYKSFPSSVATKRLFENPFDKAIFSSSFSKKVASPFL